MQEVKAMQDLAEAKKEFERKRIAHEAELHQNHIEKTVDNANQKLMHRISSVVSMRLTKEQQSQNAKQEHQHQIELRREAKERRERSMEQMLQAHN